MSVANKLIVPSVVILSTIMLILLVAGQELTLLTYKYKKTEKDVQLRTIWLFMERLTSFIMPSVIYTEYYK